MMFDDLRMAVRRLLRAPAYALAVAGLLAVALAVAGTAFNLYYGLALKPLPYPQQQRLLTLDAELLGNRYGLSPPLLTEVGKRVDGIEAIAGYRSAQRTWQVAGTATAISAADLEPALLPMLGATPALGRLLAATDVGEGAVPGLLISQAFWQQRFGGDAGVIGQRLTIDDRDHVVLGVLPASFAFPSREVQVWLPLGFDAGQRDLGNAGAFSGIQAVARLAPGATVESVKPALSALLADAFSASVIESTQMRLDARPLREAWSAGQAQSAWLMLLAGVLVWIVTGVNLSNLAVSRALSRQHDVAVQSALGADGGRLLRQTVWESVLLALLAAIIGLALVPLLLAGLALLDWLPVQTPLRFGIDIATLAVVLVLAAASAVAVALSAHGFRREPSAVALRAGGGQRQSAGRAVQRFRHALVVAQVAASLALLAGIGMLLRSSQALLAEDIGFDRRQLVTASLDHLAGADDAPARVHERLARVVDAVAGLPGVAAVGVGSQVPFDGRMILGNYRFGEDAGAEGQSPSAYRHSVDVDYFRAMGMPLLRGRAFTAEEVSGQAPVAIVDTGFVRRHLDGRDPIGQQLRMESGRSADVALTIVGVVPEVRPRRLDEPSEHAAVYQPGLSSADATLVVRTATPAEGLVEPLRAVLAAESPGEVIGPVATMGALIADTLIDRARLNHLLEGLGLLALLLSACGLYAVLAFAVGQRQREFGVRLALGAAPRGIGLNVVAQALRLLVIGCAIGLPLVWLAAQLLRNQLHGIVAFDPVSIGAAAWVLLLAALFAAALPAWRAARVDPQRALRSD